MDPSVIDLNELLGDLAERLPRNDDDCEFVLSRDVLPEPPNLVSTDCFWFRRPTFHMYDNLPVPMIDICIDKEGCRLLGLLILSTVFYRETSDVNVRLTHHSAQADLLRVRSSEADFYYHTRPELFLYGPSPVTNQSPAWAGLVTPTELPVIAITTRDEMGAMDMRRWSDVCDTVVGFGHDRACVMMARFLLNVGLESTPGYEFTMFGEASGYRGVGVGSAELRIWLPGGDGYVEAD